MYSGELSPCRALAGDVDMLSSAAVAAMRYASCLCLTRKLTRLIPRGGVRDEALGRSGLGMNNPSAMVATVVEVACYISCPDGEANEQTSVCPVSVGQWSPVRGCAKLHGYA